MLEFIQEQVDDILDQEFPEGLPPSRIEPAARKRQLKLIRKDAPEPETAS